MTKINFFTGNSEENGKIEKLIKRGTFDLQFPLSIFFGQSVLIGLGVRSSEPFLPPIMDKKPPTISFYKISSTLSKSKSKSSSSKSSKSKLNSRSKDREDQQPEAKKKKLQKSPPKSPKAPEKLTIKPETDLLPINDLNLLYVLRLGFFWSNRFNFGANLSLMSSQIYLRFPFPDLGSLYYSPNPIEKIKLSSLSKKKDKEDDDPNNETVWRNLNEHMVNMVSVGVDERNCLHYGLHMSWSS